MVDTLCDGWVGFCNTVTAPLCHLPQQWLVLNWHCYVFSLNAHNRLRSLLFRTSNNGLWLVILVTFGHPKTNDLALSNAHMTAKSSPSVGEYRVSTGDVNWVQWILISSFQDNMLRCGLINIYNISVKVSIQSPPWSNLFDNRYIIKD